MKNISLLLLLVGLLILQSCEKDIIGEGDSTEIVQEPTVSVSSSVTGIITDGAGLALENVDIIYNGKSYLSDVNGYFKIEDIVASEDGGILKFSKLDYFKNYKFFIPQNNATNFMRVQMVKKQHTGSVRGTTGGSIELTGGARIEFPSNAFVSENNLEYQGDVTVYAHWYNPSATNFSASMPGDLRALDDEGQLVQLSSFGMMAVELRAENGQELDLADGKKAILEFPVPQELENTAPQTIETWSLDEKTVYWKEEQTAELINGKYITEVSHFSFWNCDAPFPLVNIYGKVVDVDGNALTHLNICIIAFNGAQTGYGWTDSEGGFRGKVPKNQELVILIKDECGNVVFEENIGPFTGDASFGEIVVNVPDKINIAGRLVCNGMSLPTGYAKISLANGLYYIAETDQDGYFNQTILSCQQSQVKIQAYDLDNTRVSDEQSYTINPGNDLNVGEIEVCIELDEYIIYKINGGSEFLLEDPDAAVFDGDLYINSSVDSLEARFYLLAPDVMVGTGGNVSEISAYYYNSASNDFRDFFCGSGQNMCQNTVLEITELGTEGEYVTGTLMAEYTNPNGFDASIMAEFRIRINTIGTSRSISGKCWIDANEDGIRNSGETLLSGVRISLSGPNVSQTVVTAVNGEYRFEDLTPMQYTLVSSPPQGFAYTTVDVGSDDTVDSDIDKTVYIADVNSGNLENLDIGFINFVPIQCDVEVLENPSCNSQNGLAQLYLFAGEFPYEVFINGSFYGSFNSDVVTLEDLPVGDYFIEVLDSAGEECLTEFAMWDEGNIFCFVSSTSSDCGENNGTATVEIFEGSGNYTIEWSNGETESEIDNLAPGNYSVLVIDSNGCETTCFFTISETLSTVGDIVWLDQAGGSDNVFDNGIDTGVSGVYLELYLLDSSTTALLDSTFTNSNGIYQFNIPDIGDYRVKVYPPQGLNFVDQNSGTDDSLDSDIDPSSGFSDIFTVTDNCIDNDDIDAGLKEN